MPATQGGGDEASITACANTANEGGERESRDETNDDGEAAGELEGKYNEPII